MVLSPKSHFRESATNPAGQSLLGVGIYTVPEAARLTRVKPARIRRWLSEDQARTSLPVIEGSPALSFRDLIEVRFVDSFRSHGVGWKVIRLAAERAAELLQDPHPFSTKRFRTDGSRIFAEIMANTGEELLLDLVQSQYGFTQILSPYLYEGLEFSDSDGAIRWFPLAGSRRVVIDPTIAFGQPVVHPEAVPTGILAKAVQVEGSVGRVARWYMVDPQSVRDAVEYEERLAA
ncbi:MAG TPA: DUF433 domain-containing protein [Thermoanaerobaculia bacterium]|nr:DUF433 domain-containing protein [Thermoanaerobaculia bacterium]